MSFSKLHGPAHPSKVEFTVQVAFHPPQTTHGPSIVLIDYAWSLLSALLF